MNTNSNQIPRNETLSVNARYILRLCRMIAKDVREGRCSEDDLNEAIARTEPRNHGYINPEDYLSADASMKYLGIHRNRFFELTKKHKVKVRKINNVPIGYHIDDLRKLKQT